MNHLEKLEAARSAYLLLPLATFGYLSWPHTASLGLTGSYWTLPGLTGPYFALLGLHGHHRALLGILMGFFEFANGLTNERTLRLIGLLSQPKIMKDLTTLSSDKH